MVRRSVRRSAAPALGTRRYRAWLLRWRRRCQGGKLKAAARALVGGRGGNAEAAEDAERFGFPQEIIAKIRETDGQSHEAKVWASNWDIVIAFAAVLTQWRVVSVGMGAPHFVGLDYSGARVGLDLAGIAITPNLWAGIRIMEDAARAYLNGGS